MCVCLSLAATHLLMVQLNFAAVSQETPFSRDVVGGCIKETLLLLFRAVASEQNVFLTLQGIGVLYFKNNTVARLLILDLFCTVNHIVVDCDYWLLFFWSNLMSSVIQRRG